MGGLWRVFGGVFNRFLKGKITDVERFQKIIDTWSLTSESLKNQIIYYFKNYDPLNSVYIMAFSGARGNLSQVRQLVGMRGLMSDPSGQIMNLPIKKNFREGLTITDYLMSGYGARKGIVDTALKTADAGYLTRRLVDVAQDVVVYEHDCGTINGILISDLKEGEEIIEPLADRILGRTILDDFIDRGKVIVKAGSVISEKEAELIGDSGVESIRIRSVLTCDTKRGICAKCYGWDLSLHKLVDIGTSVGIRAAQSIGEPGTQLTLRTFHIGGAAQRGAETSTIESNFDATVTIKNRSVVENSSGIMIIMTRNLMYMFYKE